MPDPRDLAAARQAERGRVAAAAATHAGAAWRRLELATILRSWATLAAALLAAVADAQEQAAAGADDYVSAVLAAQRVRGRAGGRVAPAGFAGAASDGRDLLGLLLSPAYTTLRAVGAGYPPDRAAAVGGRALDAIVRTQISDAGRLADQVALVARPRVGYVRMASAPCCARCAILAGRFYRWSTGFARHPHCDCVHIPAAEDDAGDFRTSPRALFERGEIRGLSQADARAIRDGADMAQVVNAQRGMYTAGGRTFTTSGATRRGLAGLAAGSSRTAARLTPEQIYLEAGDDRAEAVRLLRLHGYLI